MGIHESQSRMWEILVGRSLPFWKHFYSQARAAFPQSLGNVTLGKFYFAVNDVQPMTFVDANSGAVLTSFDPRSTGILTYPYGDATTGHGYATEAVESLTRVAFDFPEVERLEIRVDPRNAPSAAIPRRLGYLHVATLEKNFTALPGPPRDTMVWEMTRDRFHSLTLDERLR